VLFVLTLLGSVRNEVQMSRPLQGDQYALILMITHSHSYLLSFARFKDSMNSPPIFDTVSGVSFV